MSGGEERVATGLFGDVMMMTGTEGYGTATNLWENMGPSQDDE